MSSATVHHALAEPRRRELLETLRASEEPLDATALAERVGLHVNTVRWHLGVLADAALVVAAREQRRTPGRPRVVYTAAAADAEPRRENYRLLASALAVTLRDTDDADERAAGAGRAWGRYLVERPSPAALPSRAEAIATVARLLDQEGFDPDAREHEIRMHRCPFRELAETDGRVVCAVHAGLIDGALAELRPGLGLASLKPFAEPGVCVARLSA